MARQIEKLIQAKQSLVPLARTASGNGTGIDTMGFQEVVAVVDVGAVSGTTPTLDVKLQESDTSGGTYTDITGATLAQITAANKMGLIGVKTEGRKRFIRAVATIGGTTPSFTCGVSLLLSQPGLAPAPATA